MTKHLHKYFSYEEASIMAQEAGIKSILEYQDWARPIKGLHSNPAVLYPEWTSWSTFLKGKYTKKKCSLEEAIAINKQFGIKNFMAYRKLCKTLAELPKEPKDFYGEKWCGSRVFFGAAPGETLNYEDASNLLKELGVTSGRNYYELAEVDARFPLTAEVYYKDSWQGWDKFLQKPERKKLHSYLKGKYTRKKCSLEEAIAEFFKVVVRFSRFMLLPESVRFPAPDSDLLAL